ncbi:hypothetical protein PMG71_23465 [Roseofilum sp. BLCC_M154]|uniref:Uncharacterized protein n=1 Tax=Roseofilum acuticapitatum BLCC-M154 TaxID=3022444 RepID=A0ABT7AZQ4_9CYAN|nr:hypothetical protein [Roseofilum acuticapitatum]MDJ1172393.1 hypothetical protein [Roseofilum acuticapitatum BLCC-M154]
MLRNLFPYRKHPYQEALHTLLYDFPEGLSEEEIVQKLKISKRSGQQLLRKEQIEDRIHADPYSGILIYQSKQNKQPIRSLSEEIKMAKSNHIINILKVFVISVSAAFGIIFVSIKVFVFVNVNIVSIVNINPKLPETQILQTQSPPNLIRSRVDAKLATEKRLELVATKEDLDRRIKQMLFWAEDENCESFWKKADTCYIEGRLLSQVKFEDEIEEMKLQVTQIEEDLKELD